MRAKETSEMKQKDIFRLVGQNCEAVEADEGGL